MTLLFCDGFDGRVTADLPDDYVISSSPTIQSGVARNGGDALLINSNSDQLHWSKVTDFANDKIVLGFAFRCDALQYTTILEILRTTSNNTDQCVLTLLANGQLQWTGSFFSATSTTSLVADTWYYIELQYQASNSTTVECYLAINGVTEITVPTGTYTQSDASTSIKGFLFKSTNSLVDAYFDDVYVCDQEGSKNNAMLGDCVVETLRPTGNGYVSDFDGSDGNSVDNYLLVDEAAADDDSTYVEDDTVDGSDSFTYGNLAQTPDTIHGVQVNTLAKKTTANPRQFRNITRSVATTYEGASHSLAEGYASYHDIWEDNPEDSAAWVEADVNGSEFGITVEA